MHTALRIPAMQMHDLLPMFIAASPVTGNKAFAIKRKGKYRLNDTRISIPSRRLSAANDNDD